MILQTSFPIIMPIPYNSNSAPMTDQDLKILIGIWIILNTLSLISWCITGIKYLIYLERRKKNKYLDWYFRWDNLLLGCWDFCMAFFWVLILTVWAGTFIAKFI